MGVPVINEIWQGILHLVARVWDTIPKPLKFIFFLFFLVFLGGFVNTFLFGMNYGCTSTGALMDFDDFTNALDYNFNLAFLGEGWKNQYLTGNITSIEHDNILLTYASPITKYDEFNVVSLGCQKDYSEDVTFYKPSLLFLGIDVFSYQLWLILMFGGIVVYFGWKWYDQVLH